MKYYCDKIEDVIGPAYNMYTGELICVCKRFVTKSEGDIRLEDWR
jgi:hypothetical protein